MPRGKKKKTPLERGPRPPNFGNDRPHSIAHNRFGNDGDCGRGYWAVEPIERRCTGTIAGHMGSGGGGQDDVDPTFPGGATCDIWRRQISVAFPPKRGGVKCQRAKTIGRERHAQCPDGVPPPRRRICSIGGWKVNLRTVPVGRTTARDGPLLVDRLPHNVRSRALKKNKKQKRRRGNVRCR